MDFVKIIRFVGHWISSNSRHGTHSPFVYELVEKCFYSKNPVVPRSIKEHFHKLKRSSATVSGTDFGTSAQEQVTYRVGRLAQRSAAMDFESELLARLANYHGSARVLELGANIGKSTAFMASCNPVAQVVAVEGNKGLAEFGQKEFKELHLNNTEVVNKTFDSFFGENQSKFDMVFIDGDHNFDPTLKNYEAAKAALKGEGPIVLHDIYWSSGMRSAWEKIKADSDATVTIDLFFFGLVYFRKSQPKEHFSIRFPLLRLFF